MGLLDNVADGLGDVVEPIVDGVEPIVEPITDPIVAAIEREKSLQPQRQVDLTLDAPDMLYLKDFR